VDKLTALQRLEAVAVRLKLYGLHDIPGPSWAAPGTFARWLNSQIEHAKHLQHTGRSYPKATAYYAERFIDTAVYKLTGIKTKR
jgi:hypothetical protein